MVKGRLLSIDVYDKPVCAGGQRITTLAGYRQAQNVLSIDGNDSCAFVIDLANPDVDLLVEGVILLYQYAKVGGVAEFDEYVLTNVEPAHEYGASYVRVIGRGMLFYLSRVGSLAQLTTNGAPSYVFTDTRQVADWWATYVAPALADKGWTWLQFGTSEFAAYYTLSLALTNPLDLFNQLKTLTQGEYRLRRNGVTSYLMDMVVSIGSSNPPVILHKGRSLLSARKQSDALSLATRVLARGEAGVDEANKMIVRTRWAVSALDGVNGDITVESPDGDATLKCVRYDGQFTTNGGLAASYYVVCVRTGRPFQLVNSYATTQKLRVAALGDLVVGDVLEFRRDQSNLVRTDYCGTLAPTRYSGYVSGVAGSDVTLADQWAQDPVQADDEWNGLRYEAWYSVLTMASTVTWTNLGGGYSRAQVTSTAGLAVGDLIFWTGGDNAAPFTPSEAMWEVTAVDSGTQFTYRYWYLTLGENDLSNARSGFSGTTQYLRAYRKRTNVSGFVQDSVAATNVVTVSDPANITTNDVLLFYRLDGGARLATLPSTALTTYGEFERHYTRDDLRGEHELLIDGNPHFDTWTTTPGVPDGWTAITSTFARVTTPLIGPGAVYAMSGLGSAARSPVARALFSDTDRTLALRGRIRVPTGANWASGGSSSCRLALMVSNGSGYSEPIAYYLKASGDAPASAPNATEFVAADSTTEVNLVVDLASLSISVRSQAVRFGVGVIVGLFTSGTVAWCGGVSLLQATSAGEPGFYCKTQRGNSLWHEANVQLDAFDAPLRTYAFGIFDFARLDPAAAADETLDIGTPVVAENSTLFGSNPPTQRVASLTWKHDRPAETEVVVESLPDRLTTILTALLNG